MLFRSRRKHDGWYGREWDDDVVDGNVWRRIETKTQWLVAQIFEQWTRPNKPELKSAVCSVEDWLEDLGLAEM